MRDLCRLGHDWSGSQSSNIWDVFWVNKVQMLPGVVGRWRAAGKLGLLSGS